MRILIREVRRTTGDSFEHSDSTFDGDVLSIGRATDQIIQLQDRQLALSHSELRLAGRNLSVRTHGEEHLFVNGKRSRSAKLGVGAVLEIGAYTLTIREGPEGHDFAIDVEAGELSTEEATFGAGFVQSLEQTRLSRRTMSWVLTLLALAVFLIIPGAGLFDHELAADLRGSPLPDDGLWLSGPLHSAHRFMGDDCTACHVQPFTRVRDQDCIACHVSMTHHVDASVHQVAQLEETRCASCHREHKEPTVLVRQDQGLCGDCHGDLQAHTDAPVAFADASDFEAHHPEFKLSMLVPSGGALDMTWSVERRAIDDAELIEQSNLKFPHDVHLDVEGIDGPAGKVQMVCSDCHRPEAGGAYMQPISMERHCADCHALTFDASVPDRELPHGQPDMVVRLLEEFHSRQVLLGGDPVPTARSVRGARRPGQAAMTADERAVAVEAAVRQAHQTAENIFERTTCATCHEVERVDAAGRDSPWQVLPVRLARVWMPKSWFDHRAHRTSECVDCHQAETSSEASDVLMPDIASCRECHGGGRAQNKLASDCVECHVFHMPGLDLMRPDVPGASLRPVVSDLDEVRGDRIDTMMPVRTRP